MNVPRRPLLERQRAAQARLDRVVGQDTWVRGRVLVDGLGEFFYPIKFATVYYERPYLIPGAPELESGSPASEHFPAVEMVVAGWELRTQENPGANKHYVGATLAVRVSGLSYQQVWISYHFVGNALSSVNV